MKVLKVLWALAFAFAFNAYAGVITDTTSFELEVDGGGGDVILPNQVVQGVLGNPGVSFTIRDQEGNILSPDVVAYILGDANQVPGGFQIPAGDSEIFDLILIIDGDLGNFDISVDELILFGEDGDLFSVVSEDGEVFIVIHDDTMPVPAPATGVGLFFGLCGLLVLRRRIA